MRFGCSLNETSVANNCWNLSGCYQPGEKCTDNSKIKKEKCRLPEFLDKQLNQARGLRTGLCPTSGNCAEPGYLEKDKYNTSV